MTAVQIDATTWAVTLADGSTLRVGLAAGNSTALAAIAAVAEADVPLSPEAQAAQDLAAERAGMVASGFQVRAALAQAGLLAAIEAAVAGSGDATLQLAWAHAVQFRRDSPAIAALAPGLGMGAAQLDALFRAAMAISA